VTDEEEAPVGARLAPPSEPEEKPRPKRPPRAKKAEEADEGPLSVPTFDANGERSGRARLPESVFGQEPNMAVMHQA